MSDNVAVGPSDHGSHVASDGPRSSAVDRKRDRIIAAATAAFANDGYDATRIDLIAAALGIAKGSVFGHFGSKAGLFLAVYRAAVESLPKYLDAPRWVLDEGFFATIRYWLERTEHLVREDLVAYRVSLIGSFGVDLALKREINRFMAETDPYGTNAFIQFGIDRGEVRTDIPFEMIASFVDWLMDRFQDAQVTEELDPGLFRRSNRVTAAARVDQFLELLRSAVGARGVR